MKKINNIIEVFKPKIYPDAISEATKVLESGWIGAGEYIKEFEKEFAHYCNSEYCVAFNSGTSAIHTALTCLDIPPNSKIIVSAISHISAINAIYYIDCIPVLADVYKDTGNISVESVEKLIDDGVRAVLCTHIAGYPCKLDELKELCIKKKIHLVEDCAHAIGSVYKDNLIGNGNLCCFSFGFPKAITGIEGGAITTNKKEYAIRSQIIRNLGVKNEQKYADSMCEPDIEKIGYRYSWNNVMASIALKQINYCEEDNVRREEIANMYRDGLVDVHGVYLPKYENDRKSSYFFYPIFFEKRDKLIKKLYENRIRSRIYFRKYYDNNAYADNLEGAKWYSNYELTLPINALITNDEINYIIEKIREGW